MSAVQKDKVIELLLLQGVNCYYCEHFINGSDGNRREWGCCPMKGNAICKPKEELCECWEKLKDDN